VFDHLALSERVVERELEQALMDRLQDTLLAFGHGTAFVGRQVRFERLRQGARDPWVDWGRLLPIPKTNAAAFPEVKKLLDLGLQSKQFTFSADNLSEAGRVLQGVSPSGDGTVLTASEQMPEGIPSTIAVERMEEFSPGLDTDLLALLQATAELEMEDVAISYGPVTG